MGKKGCCCPAPGSSPRQHAELLWASVMLSPLIQNISIFIWRKKKQNQRGFHVCFSLGEASWKRPPRGRCRGEGPCLRMQGCFPLDAASLLSLQGEQNVVALLQQGACSKRCANTTISPINCAW